MPADSLDIVILGDSNVWLGGDDCKNPKGWTCVFAELLQPGSIRSYARSGATLTNAPGTVRDIKENIEVLGDNNVIYNQVERLIRDTEGGTQVVPNLIIIAAGGNDAWFHSKRPGIFEDTAKRNSAGLPTSLYGSIEYACTLLRKHYPDAEIVLMTPHQMTKPDPYYLAKVCEIMETAGNESGLTVVRTDLEGPTSREEELNGYVNTYDGVHTSRIGAERTADFLIKKLRLKRNNL